MSRLDRLAHRRVRANIATFAAATLAVLLVAGVAWGLVASTRHLRSTGVKASSAAPLPASSISSVDGSGSAAASLTAVEASAGPEIEVPTLVGKSIKVAEALLTAAGLTVQTRVSDPPTAGVAPDTVVAQWPSSGALVAAGSQVVVTYQPRTATATVAPYIVVIDAGHQQKADLALEPIGPGSRVTKPKVAGGATGATSGQPEYALALSISLKVRAALVAKGVRVVMVRSSNAVDIPNSKRAQLANAEKADLFLRVHLNGSTDPGVRGISVLYPAGNAWVKSITAASLQAAKNVETGVLKATGAPWQGLSGRSDQSGFNFSTRPAITVECGYLSNADDDKLLVTPAYQQKVADGISAGVMAFLQGK